MGRAHLDWWNTTSSFIRSEGLSESVTANDLHAIHYWARRNFEKGLANWEYRINYTVKAAPFREATSSQSACLGATEPLAVLRVAANRCADYLLWTARFLPIPPFHTDSVAVLKRWQLDCMKIHQQMFIIVSLTEDLRKRKCIHFPHFQIFNSDSSRKQRSFHLNRSRVFHEIKWKL